MPSRNVAAAAAAALTIVACAGASASTSTAPTPIDIPPAPADASAPLSTSRAIDACAAPCGGRPGDALVEALSHRAKQAHRCYDNALVTDRTLRGRVQVHMAIGADGRVCSVRAESDKAMDSVASCVAAYFKAVAGEPFPPPDGGCADINLPINFVPRPSDAGAP